MTDAGVTVSSKLDLVITDADGRGRAAASANAMVVPLAEHKDVATCRARHEHCQIAGDTMPCCGGLQCKATDQGPVCWDGAI